MLDSIQGLSPAIAVPQRRFHENPRSTVGTLTEIHDHLRLLFTHVGRTYCQRCGSAITVHTVQQMVDDLLKLPSGTRIQVLAPLPCSDPTEFQRRIETVIRAGFVRIKVDGEVLELADLADSAAPGGADLTGSASLGRGRTSRARLRWRKPTWWWTGWRCGTASPSGSPIPSRWP